MPPRISRRKRLTKVKGYRYKKKQVQRICENETSRSEFDEGAGMNCDVDCSVNDADCDANDLIDAGKHSASRGSLCPDGTTGSDHNYCSTQETPNVLHSEITNETPVQFATLASRELITSVSEVLSQVKLKVDAFLPLRWISSIVGEKLHIFYLSAKNNKAIQRALEISLDGNVELYVHRHSFPIDKFLGGYPAIPLEPDTVDFAVDRIIGIVNNVRNIEVCSGHDELQYEHVWSRCAFGEIDKNPYGECRYVETFRSLGCLRLVKSNKWRCSECSKMTGPLRRKAKAAADEERSKFTSNKFLNEEQKLTKLSAQRKELDNTKKKLTRVQQRMQEVIKKQGVSVEETMSHALSEILMNSEKVNPAQSIFLEQQIKASQQKNAVGMRWHPTMIRFALSIHLTSPAAYELLRQTGMVQLPSSRTLFDYSHAKPAAEGIDKGVLEKLAEKVKVLSNQPNKKTGRKEFHKKYHILMGDEMYISQNFQKSTGQLIGFTSLDEVDTEVKMLEHLIDKCDKEFEETIASRIMVFMVKGVSNGLKEVIATYGVGNMSAVQLKVWSWQVIGALERSGVAVVAFVCDGSSVNRAFIQSHKPANPCPSGIVYDTVNKCASNRILYFLSDVPHLLKTIRNCLLNSRWDGKKSRRKMMKNNSRLSWDYIIKLYESKRVKTLRKSWKLNAMNVYPDSYARMKVKFAGQVLSNTVSKDLESQGWPEALATAQFLSRVNKWFDCLNGAHSSTAKKTRNSDVAPYTSVDDPRFEVLDSFLKYLEEWEYEAKNCTSSVDQTVDVSVNNIEADLCTSEIDEGGPPEEEETHFSRRLLSKQTLDGIRMTTLAFKPLVVFLLKEGATFINARIFTQDPLEQHFSKLRAGHGGSNNPNLGQALKRTHALELIGEMGMKKKRGNSSECDNFVTVTTEKLPKLKSKHTPKFLQSTM